MSMRLLPTAVVGVIAAMAGTSALALDNSFELKVGVGDASNVLRVPVNPQRETIDVLDGSLALSEVRSRFEAAALGALEFQKYQGDAFKNELVGNFRGRAIGTLLPEQLRWTGEYFFGQTPINSFGAPTPDNRQNVSAFSTGPSLNQSLGSTNRLRLDLRYTNFSYAVSRVNTRRFETRGALVHDFSSRVHVSLNVNVQKATLTQVSSFADFDQQEGYGRLSLSNSRSMLNLDLGYTRASNDGPWTGGTLARLGTLRRLSSSTSVSLSVGRAFSDSGASFLQQQSLGGSITTSLPASQNVPDQFLSEFATAGWGLHRSRSAIDIQVMHFKETYQRLTLNNRKRTLASITASRKLSGSLSAELRGAAERQQYDLTGHSFDDRSYGGGLAWKPGHAFSVHLDVDRIKRVGDALIPSYEDTQTWLRIGYAHGSVAAMAAASTLSDAATMDAAAALDRQVGFWE